MTRSRRLRFLRAQSWAVKASVYVEGKPASAVIGAAVTERPELAFDAFPTSREAGQLRGNPRSALLMGWDGGRAAE